MDLSEVRERLFAVRIDVRQLPRTAADYHLADYGLRLWINGWLPDSHGDKSAGGDVMTRSDVVTIYKDRAKHWRWRLKAANGRNIASPGEGFARRIDCVRLVTRLYPLAKLIIEGRRSPAVALAR